MSSTLERITNAVVILTCVLVSYAVLAKISGARAAATQYAVYRIGDKIEENNIDYKKSPWTAIVFVKTSCQYCTDSMPLYRTIADLSSRHFGTVRFVAAGIESTDAVKSYLAGFGVTPDAVYQVSTNRPTPTLVLADSNGIVRAVWIGQQDDSNTKEVLARLVRLAE